MYGKKKVKKNQIFFPLLFLVTVHLDPESWMEKNLDPG